MSIMPVIGRISRVNRTHCTYSGVVGIDKEKLQTGLVPCTGGGHPPSTLTVAVCLSRSTCSPLCRDSVLISQAACPALLTSCLPVSLRVTKVRRDLGP